MSNPGDRPISPLSISEALLWQSKLSWLLKAKWKAFWGEARTRILLWYVLILTFTFGLSVPIFIHLLFADIDSRVRQDMAEELEDFRNFLAGEFDFKNDEPDENGGDGQATRPKSADAFQLAQVASHSNLDSQSPKTETQLKRFFEAYMAHRIPEDEVYFIAFVGGQFYKSSPRARPKELGLEGAFMKRWAKQAQPEQGEHLSNDPDVGSILYIVEPVQSQGQPLGVFVIAHTTAGERAEGLAVIKVAAYVAVGVLLLAFFLVWLASGRVLQPLQTLATTVESVGESNLTQRIPVHGQGELARLATQFNHMMNRVETAFVSQREFVNDAGHELRTPITIIRGHLEVMDVHSVEQQETLAIVTDELDRMSRFVDDLIFLAKAERPDFLKLEVVDIGTLTHELFIKAQALAPRNWCLEEVAQGQAMVDRQRLTQAVMNLAHNATQHTQVTDTITLGSAIAKNKIHLWVRDTGTGIALTDQKRIFERFARAAHQHRRSEGAGLGLSIVKAIAVAHGGEVTLRSQLGEGSTFAIVLPLKPSAIDGDASASS